MRGAKRRRFDVNQQVGQWTLLEYEPARYAGRKVVRKARWKCVCSCGALRYVQADNLANGSSRSCGHASPPSTARWGSRNVPRVASVFDLAAQ